MVTRLTAQSAASKRERCKSQLFLLTGSGANMPRTCGRPRTLRSSASNGRATPDLTRSRSCETPTGAGFKPTRRSNQFHWYKRSRRRASFEYQVKLAVTETLLPFLTQCGAVDGM